MDSFSRYLMEQAQKKAVQQAADASTRAQHLDYQGSQSSGFADRAQGNFATLGQQAQDQVGRLQRLQSGEDSLSAEQLRQGLAQGLNAQRSMALSAAPRDAAMAARTAAINSGRLASGMSGAAAQAGIQERRAATDALNNLLNQQRAQEMQAALGARGNAISAYSSQPQDKSWWEKYGPAISSGAALAAMAVSDRRAKHAVEDGEDEARAITKGLKSYRFRYKDERNGKGSQYGVMAQDLERAGLKHAVVDTPRGKMVDGAKLSTANTALIGALGRRLAKLEGSRK